MGDKIRLETVRGETASLPLPTAKGVYDLCASIKATIVIPPREMRVIPTGVAIDFPAGHIGLLCASGALAARSSVAIINSPYVVKSRAPIEVYAMNHGQREVLVQPGQHIAQLAILAAVDASFLPVPEFSTEDKS